MAATYPGGIKDFGDDLVDGEDYPLVSDINDPRAEIEAIETELGLNPSGSSTDVATRLTAIEAGDYLLSGKKRTETIWTAYNDPAASVQQGYIQGTIIKTPALFFATAATNRIHFTWRVLPNVDTTENVTLLIDCVIETAEATNYNVDLALYYRSVASNELFTGTEQSSTDTQDVQTWGANKRYVNTSLVISAAQIAADDLVTGCIERNPAATLEYPYRFGITNISLEYTCKDPA